ncbi:MAG: NADH-quinone oxidoreductase subunit C [Bryobacteraceae bacterium]
MQEVLDQLQQEYAGRIAALAETSYPDQLCAAIAIADVPPIAAALQRHNARLVTVFAEDRVVAEQVFYNYYVFERCGDPCYLILCAAIPADDSRFPSLASVLPSANWQEREIQDWFGIHAEGHPNPRRVALHDHWPDVHPLRKDFPLREMLPAFEGEQHIYRPTLGEGVFQIPVGPVHAGIIEPGHFNFAVAGEPILYLQLRMFYTHKGTEKLFEQIPVPHGVFLAESVSGDSAFSHGTAFCQAVEKAGGVEVPFRAEVMRTVLLELERIYNHVGDIGAIAMNVGFVIANAHAGRVREMVLGINEELSGSRLLRGMVCLGGVRRDWSPGHVDKLSGNLDAVEREFRDLVALIQSSDSTRDRLEHTGFLHPEKAAALGIVGVGGRASGVDLDVRRDHPYAAYRNLTLKVPVYREGDVLRRMQVRIDEVFASIGIVRAAAENLPDGPYRAPVGTIPPGRCALTAVEGWRGEIVYWIRTGARNRLERCKVKDPSVNNWPALVEAVEGNIIADFPVINKSFNLSYSGTDR